MEETPERTSDRERGRWRQMDERKREKLTTASKTRFPVGGKLCLNNSESFKFQKTKKKLAS